MGWGINMVEGFVAQRVWTLALLLSLGSGVFAIIYTLKFGDIQGAFGVAGWMLGIASLVIGGLQAWLE
jgi:polysaccharide pyruvyl transferase WcaK-like protein